MLRQLKHSYDYEHCDNINENPTLDQLQHSDHDNRKKMYNFKITNIIPKL